MTNDRISSKLEALNDRLTVEFGKVNIRLDALEKHSITRSDVHGAVFQGLAFAAAAIVGPVVVLNSVGAFS